MQIIYLIRIYSLEYTKNSYNSAIKDNPIKKWTKNTSRHFSREDMQMTIKHMKRCSILLVIGKCRLKPQYHLTPIRMAIFTKMDVADEDVEKSEPLQIVGRNLKKSGTSSKC